LKVGIEAIHFSTSKFYVDMTALAIARGVAATKFTEGLGQLKMAVFPPDEDVVSVAANAAYKVLSKVDISEIDLLLFATESGIDQAKSAGIYVHRLLQLPARCRVMELKQACYSATLGLRLSMSYLRDNPDKKVLLIASDIAKYGLGTAGEPSQGGGAVAMVLSCNPALLAIEAESGFCTEDVMDFWRPNYLSEALVDGKYSCEMYLRSLQRTWQDYHSLTGRDFSSHAWFCLHSPVPKLSEKGYKVLRRECGMSRLSDVELSHAMQFSLSYNRQVGNCYTASLYLSLLSLLDNCPHDLAGKRLGMYSYGAGCTAEFFSCIVQENYQNNLSIDDNRQALDARHELSVSEYEAMYKQGLKTQLDLAINTDTTSGIYRFAGTKQHKRQYEILS